MNKLFRAAPTLGLSLAFALLAVALCVGAPDLAHAAVLAKATGAQALHHWPDLSIASIGLAGLRAKETDLVTRAAAKFAEISEDLAPEAIRTIETEHAELMTQVEAVRGKIAEAEKAPPADTAGQRAAALKAERERASTIRDLGRRAGMKQEEIEAALDGDTSVDAFRTLVCDQMHERAAAVPTGSGARARIVGATDEEKRGAAVENALLHRFDPGTQELSEQGRQYRGMTLLEMGRDLLEAHGVRTRGLSKHELASEMLMARIRVGDFSVRTGGMNSTADFPNVLANVANKTLRAGYQAAPQTFRPIVRVVTLPDFKDVSRVQLGEAPKLEKVNEHGEFKRGTMGDSAEKYRLATFGKIVGITRQVLINDDLDAFTRVPRSFGVAAANLESDLVWGQITANPVMGDGKTLFHAAHGNLGVAGAITTDVVGAGRQQMRVQTGLDGKTLLNINPVYILVPTALETAAEKFLGQIYPTTTADGVPQSMRKLIGISEPRLDAASATNWYLAGAPEQIDIVELAYLEGQQGLFTETRMGFEVDGMEVKVRQDVAAKVIDWRGLWKNPQ
ncbi:prohead protease/major capsid protein fusion protein [uncultured Methylobacterium sp.]|uniref:prohead protease/major capsid protein fusion protein n=1 Tax=uncultured Methylobacterium sp. TaxID=157278 RepID=UPI0035CB63F0